MPLRLTQSEVAALYDAHGQWLYAQAWRMLRDSETAGDMVQQAFVKLLRSPPNDREAIPGWLKTVVYNECITHIRRRGRERTVQDGAPVLDAAALSRRPDGGSRSMEEQEELQLLNEALESLDEDKRSILLLREWGDLDYRQIAEMLDIPVGTVMSRLNRARTALREAFEAAERRRGGDRLPFRRAVGE